MSANKAKREQYPSNSEIVEEQIERLGWDQERLERALEDAIGVLSLLSHGKAPGMTKRETKEFCTAALTQLKQESRRSDK